MISFETDYINGAHPKVLEAFIKSNNILVSGYGSDPFCDAAKAKIIEAVGKKDAKVHFLSGGTQTNTIVIDSFLNQWDGVISAKTGHIAVHEAGAVEYTGHKVFELPEHNGKLCPKEVDEFCATFYGDGFHEHMVFPGMVYISFPTELGTLYSKKELEELYAVCKKYNMPLFVDGARLAYGLMSKDNDVTIQDLANLCDVFYIGGTKCGSLIGEAVVFTHDNMPPHFLHISKKHCGLLAKGRILGVSFDALFTDNLYFEIGKHAMDCAEKLVSIFKKKGYTFFKDSPTNQQFVILDDDKMEELAKEVKFSIWEKYNKTQTVVRFVTSWSTTEEDLKRLEEIL